MHIRAYLASTIAAAGLAFAAAGCGDDGDSASTAEPTASLTSATITQTDLVVTDCDNDLASGIALEAIKGSFLLQVDAPDGTGSISYTTGGEEDVGTEGTVDSVTLEEDGSFTVEGSWDGGEAYTLTGSCAGS